jgi:hypothetical protein
MNKCINTLTFMSCLGLLKYIKTKGNNKSQNDNKVTIKKLTTYNDLADIFQYEEKILRNQYKNILHLSTPFNRKIRHIYSLPFFYAEYENYNFNKLSDFFLNIHIFIN